MAFRLPRLPRNVALVDAARQASVNFQKWWQSVVSKIEEQEAAQNLLIEELSETQDELAAAQAELAAQQASIVSLDNDKQDASEILTSLSDLSSALGVLVQTDVSTVEKLPIGAMNDTSILNRATGDGRYVRQSVGAVWASPSGTADRTTYSTYTAPTISNPPTQAEVQAIANHLQVLSQHMKAMTDDLRTNKALTP